MLSVEHWWLVWCVRWWFCLDDCRWRHLDRLAKGFSGMFMKLHVVLRSLAGIYPNRGYSVGYTTTYICNY